MRRRFWYFIFPILLGFMLTPMLAAGQIDDTEQSVHWILTNPHPNNELKVIGVHGIMGNYATLTKLVSMMVDQIGAKEGYSMAYHWSNAIDEGAQQCLNRWLSKQPAKTVILVGDSFGCTIARLSIVTGEAAQDAARDLWLIAGPNQGSVWATAADTALGLTTTWINGHSGGKFIVTVSNTIKDMVPNNPILNFLNYFAPPANKRPQINYYLFAADLLFGTGDHVVSIRSALCEDVDLSKFTTGSIHKLVIKGEFHETIFRNESSINKMIRFYKENQE